MHLSLDLTSKSYNRMSFGYGIGDIITVTTLALKAVQNTRQACGQYDELTREVTSLHIVLSRLRHESETPLSLLLQLSDNEKLELSHVVNGCGEILKVLNAILEKYGTFSEDRSVTKLWQRVRFGNGEMQDLSTIRSQLSSQTASLALFLHLVSLGSQGRVERQMAMQMGALQELQHSIDFTTSTAPATAGNRESSILTTYENDDKDFWKEFRRELIAEGCSSKVMVKHRDLVLDYIKQLESHGGMEGGLETEMVQSIDQLPLETASTAATFDFDNEVVKSRIYTRILASASVRNSVASLPILVPGDKSADWPLVAAKKQKVTVVSGRVESKSRPPLLFFPTTEKKEETPTAIQLRTDLPDVDYKLPASSQQDLPFGPRKNSTSEASGSKPTSSPSPGSGTSLTPKPQPEPRSQMPQQTLISNTHETFVASLQTKRSVRESTTYRYSKYPEEHTLVVMGAGGIEKSHFVIQVSFLKAFGYITLYLPEVQFIQSHFVDEYDPTIEDSYRKQCIIDDRAAFLDILDTAGQEEYSSVREQYMKAGDGFILMYSIANRASFDDLLTFQQQILRVKDKDYFPMILVGNQSDRVCDREVSTNQGHELARLFGCPFVEASAKNDINVEKVFYDLVREIRRYRSELEAISQKRLQDIKEHLLEQGSQPPRGGLKEYFLRRRRP